MRTFLIGIGQSSVSDNFGSGFILSEFNMEEKEGKYRVLSIWKGKTLKTDEICSALARASRNFGSQHRHVLIFTTSETLSEDIRQHLQEVSNSISDEASYKQFIPAKIDIAEDFQLASQLIADNEILIISEFAQPLKKMLKEVSSVKLLDSLIEAFFCSICYHRREIVPRGNGGTSPVTWG
ncbi:MAG TPA: hypothetical protein DEG17_08865 [Cyanobacteria bacterium UBA11149]|nr:hypothetical protein [Cyanobacteria bacterium UBA11367]HBE60422.1 hypothetical protein [Cyanobacteria bacterium UBA11366]HBK65894.1 hypothetical protein [Cyanobacteria bacterium UBA11166]HBR75329.1 hypothetical protein [Cyanobacteria bacterium UBA11159]HBS70474.1 hypothetical protein [Cyanobacteria bacterium UBA11153]HBW88966.1 hypothetical protein [Cyanobacteria bacterium UBA11149]HCA97273.1 hypothetical protein [Cyanobacteria bacterium UBA9226]